MQRLIARLEPKRWQLYAGQVICSALVTGCLWVALPHLCDLNNQVTMGPQSAEYLTLKRYGTTDGPFTLADLAIGYDNSRDIVRVATVLTFIFVVWWPLDKRTGINRIIWELVNLSCIPIAVYMLGMIWVNCFSPLGGGL